MPGRISTEYHSFGNGDRIFIQIYRKGKIFCEKTVKKSGVTFAPACAMIGYSW